MLVLISLRVWPFSFSSFCRWKQVVIGHSARTLLRFLYNHSNMLAATDTSDTPQTTRRRDSTCHRPLYIQHFLCGCFPIRFATHGGATYVAFLAVVVRFGTHDGAQYLAIQAGFLCSLRDARRYATKHLFFPPRGSQRIAANTDALPFQLRLCS